MSDIFTKQKRSDIMSKIQGKETKPEISVRKILFAKGFRYRKNVKNLLGKPDIVLPKYKTVIFVNGCFWHGHNCPAGKLPETRKDFWKNKISGNIERDKKEQEQLKNSGWKVIIVWQCEIKNRTLLDKRIRRLEKEILRQ